MKTSLLVLLLSLAGALSAQPPSPREHLGYTPGDDYKLADYADVTSYFQKLAKSSDRIRLEEFGKTSLGKPMFAAYISNAGNLRKLDRYKEISRRLALGRSTANEARSLAAEGKAIVWIDSGLHASEVAPVQQAPDLAYRMITQEDAETKLIRENVILVQIPVINPDGLDMIAHWYRGNAGTPYELAALPDLYQKYAGHDNNRDWFMLNLPETRHVTRMLFQQWFPQIVYNQHQSPAFPARIFVPPYAEPLNPNIPAPVMEGINMIGAAMKERFAREDKPGVLSYWGYDAWWNGGLRSVPAFHNMHGILTETALYSYATPKTYSAGELPVRFPNGIPTKEPSVFYQKPWLGGKWGVRDAVEYMLTADWAILELAASRREQFLWKAHELAAANIGHAAGPYAYVVPADQADRWTAAEMLRRLAASGIEMQRARAAFEAGGKNYAEGSYVLLASQPFRGYLMDLMEPQAYPELRSGTTGPTKRPYDIAGWTLSMQMGVAADRIDKAFGADLETVGEVAPVKASLDHRDNSSFLATADILGAGGRVRWGSGGEILTESGAAFDSARWELRKPRVGIYQPYISNMDEGWTEWVLDTFKIPFTILRNADFKAATLNDKYDVILFASQSPESILHGNKLGESEGGASSTARRVRSTPRPEHTGGLGLTGLANLETFVRKGGTLIALAQASDMPLQYFPLLVRNALRRPAVTETEGDGQSDARFYCPGSLLRITVDNTHPIGFGMPKEAIAFSSGGEAFDVSGADSKSVANYARTKLLASGWVSGERAVLGKSVVAESKLGEGRVVVYGIRPQHRGQPFGTFKLLLNAIYLGAAQKLN